MAPQARPPQLQETKTSKQLVVGGKPFLMLAAELHNSTWSNPKYMSTKWASMKERHINTLLGPVAWDMIEPVEGKFNFVDLDQIVIDARENGFRLVLLWFGMYKNALSSYAPAWVRQDPKRFPRVHIRQSDGTISATEQVQPFCEAAQEADAKAFSTMMRHLREIDSNHHTVIMVQVENEMGTLVDSRDRSPSTDKLMEGAVPTGLLEHLQASWNTTHPTFRHKFPNFPVNSRGPLTWTEAFGDGVWRDDIFMAYGFSTFVQRVAAAGRAEYNIPLYANVALCSEEPDWTDTGVTIPDGVFTGLTPGQFPSGGPVGHNIDVYRYNAPDIEFYAPDIYLQDYEKIADCFAYKGMPLFIPEQRRDEYGVRRIWAALGNFCSMGCSPFGIDSLPIRDCPLRLHYGLLSKVQHQILDAQATRPDRIMGFFFDDVEETSRERVWEKVMGDFKVKVERAFVFGKASSGAGIIIENSDGTYLIVGFGFQVTFESTDEKSTFTGILSLEELDTDERGDIVVVRRLNGDETNHHRLVIMPSQNPQYGCFHIPFMMPAETMITRCRPYSLQQTGWD